MSRPGSNNMFNENGTGLRNRVKSATGTTGKLHSKKKLAPPQSGNYINFDNQSVGVQNNQKMKENSKSFGTIQHEEPSHGPMISGKSFLENHTKKHSMQTP